ncbi:MAG: hypothetical protein J7M40_20325 [Planctomycetes bacterium]|nr:hypothetical protein [Planctomycetota bacterium]
MNNIRFAVYYYLRPKGILPGKLQPLLLSMAKNERGTEMKTQRLIPILIFQFFAAVFIFPSILHAAPLNDDCINAEEIFGFPFSAVVDNSTATGDGPAGSCNSSGATIMDNDIWYTFVAIRNSTLLFEVNTQTYDGLMVVYEGTDCSNLVEIICVDAPDKPAVFNVDVSAGQTYWLQIGDWGISDGGGTTSILIEETSPDLGPVDLISPYTASAPAIDGSISFEEWSNAATMDIDAGQLRFMHDNTHLYLLIDIVADTVNDGFDDYFWLTFDVNVDGLITSYVDLLYSMPPAAGDLFFYYYLGPGVLTGAQLSVSLKAKGFGPTMNYTVNHTFWELAIDFTEIDTMMNKTVRVGVRTASSKPAFTLDVPPDHITDFADLIDILLFTPEQTVFDCDITGSGGDNATATHLRCALSKHEKKSVG